MEDSISTSGWAALPDDLLIRMSLPLPFADRVRSAAACSSWHSAGLSHLLPPQGAPCLFYFYCTSGDGDGDGGAALLSVAENKCYTFPLPLAAPPLHKWSLLGSSNGFLVCACGGVLELLNPITGAHIALPHAAALGDHTKPVLDSHDRISHYKCGRRCYGPTTTAFPFTEAVLIPSSDRSCGNNYSHVVVAIHGTCRWLSFAMAGDRQWTSMIPSS